MEDNKKKDEVGNLGELKDLNERMRDAEEFLTKAAVPEFALWIARQLRFAAVIIANSSGKIIWVNSMAGTTFGYKEHELPGQNLDILIPEHLKLLHHKAFAQAVKTKHSRVIDEHIVLDTEGLTKTGKIIPISITLTMLLVGGESYFGAIVRLRTVK